MEEKDAPAFSLEADTVKIYDQFFNLLWVDADPQLALVRSVETHAGGGHGAHVNDLLLLARAVGSGGVSRCGLPVCSLHAVKGGMSEERKRRKRRNR